MEIISIVTMKSAQLSTILENHDIFDDKEVKLAARMLVKANKAQNDIIDYHLLSFEQAIYRG